MASWPYSTARWQRLRKHKLLVDPLCEHCRRGGRTQAAGQVDHVQAINQGGDPWAWDNLRSLCPACHARKTMLVDVGGADHVPIKGVDPLTGKPVDPEDWFNKKISQG